MTSPHPFPHLAAFLADRLAQPRPVALGERRDGALVTLTSAEVHQRAAEVACAIRLAGLARGDRVAIIAENSVDWLIADFGILYAGCVVVPVFASAASDQLAFILADSETKLVFAGDAAIAQRIRACAESTPPIITFRDGGAGGFDRFAKTGAQVAQADPGRLDGFQWGIQPNDLAVLIYTSGTTGMPKGVMLSHNNLISNALSTFDPVVSGMDSSQTALSVLPFAHIYEHTDVLGYLSNLVTLYVTTPDNLLQDMREVRPHFAAFVPRIFERVIAGIIGKAAAAGGLQAKLVPWAIAVGTAYERAQREGGATPTQRLFNAIAQRLVLSKIKPALGLDRLHYFGSGSAPLHRDTALALAAMGIDVCEGYGLTETSPCVTINRPADIKLGTVGPPIAGVQVKIAEDGEILVKGPNVMLGYYHTPADEQPFTADGWFQTGDIGTFDGDHLVITDRKKELFKSSGGKWIAPSRIESAVKRSVYIGQVMAFGDNQPHPAVVVAPNWDLIRTELELPATMTTAEMAADDRVRKLVIREVESQTADLASFEQVRRLELLPRDLTIEDGELSPTLKIKRRVVEERYAPLIARAYSEDLHEREALLGR